MYIDGFAGTNNCASATEFNRSAYHAHTRQNVNNNEKKNWNRIFTTTFIRDDWWSDMPIPYNWTPFDFMTSRKYSDDRMHSKFVEIVWSIPIALHCIACSIDIHIDSPFNRNTEWNTIQSDPINLMSNLTCLNIYHVSSEHLSVYATQKLMEKQWTEPLQHPQSKAWAPNSSYYSMYLI